jgi:hypothetical protein
VSAHEVVSEAAGVEVGVIERVYSGSDSGLSSATMGAGMCRIGAGAAPGVDENRPGFSVQSGGWREPAEEGGRGKGREGSSRARCVICTSEGGDKGERKRTFRALPRVLSAIRGRRESGGWREGSALAVLFA